VIGLDAIERSVTLSGSVLLVLTISDHQSDRSLRAIYRHAFTIRPPALGSPRGYSDS
jgi:hypothetical protein